MPRHLTTLVADRILIDQYSNSITFVGMIDGVTVATLPAPAPRIMIASVWLGEPGETELEQRTRLIDPSGQTVVDFDAGRAAFGANGRLRNIGITGGFLLPASGQYEWLVEYRRSGEWVEAFRLPMSVEVQSAEVVRDLAEQRARAASSNR